MSLLFFFFQAEDGIRDLTVTGVQTCALPIWGGTGSAGPGPGHAARRLSRRARPARRRWAVDRGRRRRARRIGVLGEVTAAPRPHGAPRDHHAFAGTEARAGAAPR